MRLILVYAAASILTSAAFAQTADEWKQPTICEKEAISLQVVSLKRAGPGRLSLTFQVENSANLATTIGSGVSIFDDAGNEWKNHGANASPSKFPPGIRVTSTLGFSRDIGGSDSKSASLSSRVLVHVAGHAKNLGYCVWTVKNIPIQ